jgi:hypothetical protein
VLSYAPFDQFDEIVLGDAEFISRTGELYDPVCYAFRELRSGRSDAIWYDAIGPTPPHAHGSNVLFIGFTAAEPEFFHSINWKFDMAFLDLRVEGIRLTNLALPRDDPRRQRLPRSLISFLRWKNIQDGDAALKDLIRERIIKGKPFTNEERILILRYCLGDVLLLEKLLWAMLPDIGNVNQALMRGEYVKFTAEMFCRGIPADPWSAALLRPKKNRTALRLRAISDTSLTHGLYQGPSLTQLQMREFVVRHKLDWRTTGKVGRLGIAHRDFVALEELHPEFRGLADITKPSTSCTNCSCFPAATDASGHLFGPSRQLPLALHPTARPTRLRRRPGAVTRSPRRPAACSPISISARWSSESPRGCRTVRQCWRITTANRTSLCRSCSA